MAMLLTAYNSEISIPALLQLAHYPLQLGCPDIPYLR
jgi:hypothetical protein